VVGDRAGPGFTRNSLVQHFPFRRWPRDRLDYGVTTGTEVLSTPSARAAARRAPRHLRNLPNTITIGRLLLVPEIGALIAARQIAGAIALITVFGALDVVDGALARRLGAASRLGAYLDSAADRLLYLAMLVGAAASGALNRTVGTCLGSAAAIQCFLAIARLRPSMRRAPRPKTLVGPVFGALLLCRLATTSPTLGRAFDLALLMTALDGLWWYATSHRAARPSRVEERVIGWNEARNRILRNYGGKATENQTAHAEILTLPNMITTMRMVPAGIGLVLLLDRQVVAATLFGVVFVVLDIVDGFVAREMCQVSRVGTILDVVVDKLALVGVVVVACKWGWLPLWLTVGAGIRVGLIAVLALALGRLRHRPPRNTWSPAANATLLAVMLHGSSATLAFAVLANTHNALHYCYHAGQRVLQTMERRRGGTRRSPF
jgi:phosphatidylglycerophosphate synthase